MRMLLLIALTLPLSGCLMELLTATAIQGELAAESAQSATRVLSYAKESLANTELQHAIDVYAAEQGHYPPSLEALVPDYLHSVPKTPTGRPYAYDPSTGRLIDPAAAPAQVHFTNADRQNLQEVKAGIYSYWQSTGYFPRTLDDLDPLYMQAVPALSSGGAFIYDPQTGSVYHPAELAAAAAGISAQNKLNSANRSGTSNPRNMGQRGVNGIVGRQNDRQMKALRDLDLH